MLFFRPHQLVACCCKVSLSVGSFLFILCQCEWHWKVTHTSRSLVATIRCSSKSEMQEMSRQGNEVFGGLYRYFRISTLFLCHGCFQCIFCPLWTETAAYFSKVTIYTNTPLQNWNERGTVNCDTTGLILQHSISLLAIACQKRNWRKGGDWIEYHVHRMLFPLFRIFLSNGIKVARTGVHLILYCWR